MEKTYLKHCPTCNGKVDSEAPFCPHCNKLKPKEGWCPVIVEPTKFKNITIILPKGRAAINFTIIFSPRLPAGHTYANWVISNFYEQLEKQAGKQLSDRKKNKTKIQLNAKNKVKYSL